MNLTQHVKEKSAVCHACSRNRLTQIGEKAGYPLMQCLDCRTVQVHPMPTSADLDAHYQNYSTSRIYSAKRQKKIANAQRRLRYIRRFGSGNRFIDVGCNLGYAVHAAQTSGFDARGIDIDRDAINQASDDFGADRFEAMRVEDLAARGDTFDVAYSSEVIEHMPDPRSFAQSLAAILKPGGIAYITTPDAGHFRVPKTFTDWNEVKPPRHLVYFTKQGLRSLLTDCGFLKVNFKFTFKPGIRAIAVKG